MRHEIGWALACAWDVRAREHFANVRIQTLSRYEVERVHVPCRLGSIFVV